jgi:predicted transcriptional regulator
VSESVTLHLKSEEEICLPDWIAVTSLTLEEIGAVAVMACLETQAGGYEELLAARLRTPEMKCAMRSLQTKGVFSVSIKKGAADMRLDLDAVAPE